MKLLKNELSVTRSKFESYVLFWKTCSKTSTLKMATFVYDAEKSGAGVETFTYVPGAKERSAGQDGLTILNRLVSLIPEGTGYTDDGGDYPIISPSLMQGSQVHYSMRRPVFSIAGVPFFRRYNDDYNPVIMQGECKNVRVSWIPGGTSRAAVARLLQLVETHGIDKVTQDQVLKALRD
jgi:hypothetical protein